MYKIFKGLIGIVWILDVLNIDIGLFSNLPWLQFILNDKNSFNGIFWFLMFVTLPPTNTIIRNINNNKEEE